MSFEGELILNERKNLNIRQNHLAKDLGITPQFLGRVEKGAVQLPLTKVTRLLIALNITRTKYINARLEDEKKRILKVLNK